MPRPPAVSAAFLTACLLLGGVFTVWGRAQQTAPPGSPLPADSTSHSTDNPTVNPTDAPDNAENASLELVRKSEQDGKERRIRIVRTGTSDETGIFTVCSPQDDDPPDAPNIAVFSESGAGGIQISIDKNLIRVPLAVVTQKQPKEGQDGSDGRVEASAGSARFLDEAPAGVKDRLSRCAVQVTPKPAPDTVFVTQGKTELKGKQLVYDETDGIARIDGPITFSRSNQKDPLTGSSDRIEVNVDEEKTTLVGNVVLNSEGGRVSKAARVEYDDTKNIARLIGAPDQPAQSVKGGDQLTAGMILYDLDKNEVYAVKADGGTISGEFQDGGDTSSSGGANPTPGTPKP